MTCTIHLMVLKKLEPVSLLAPVGTRRTRWNNAEQSVYVWRIMTSPVVPSERGYVAIRPSGDQIAQCPTESNNGV